MGALIKSRRVSLRLTQQQIADAVGVSRQTIEALENGRNELLSDFDTLKAVGRELGLSQVEMYVAAGILDEGEVRIARRFDVIDQVRRDLAEANQKLERIERDFQAEQVESLSRPKET